MQREPLPFGALLQDMLAEGMTYEQIAARYPGNDRNSVYYALRQWRLRAGIATYRKCVHCNDDVRVKNTTKTRQVPVVCAYCKRNHKTPMPTEQQITQYRIDGLSWDEIVCLHPGNQKGTLQHRYECANPIHASGAPTVRRARPRH